MLVKNKGNYERSWSKLVNNFINIKIDFDVYS